VNLSKCIKTSLMMTCRCCRYRSAQQVG